MAKLSEIINNQNERRKELDKLQECSATVLSPQDKIQLDVLFQINESLMERNRVLADFYDLMSVSVKR